jgi:hypothetical protein
LPEPDFLLKRSDTSSAISSTLEDSNGVPVDILGATIRFKMAPIAGGTLTIDAAATNSQVGAGGTSNPTTGQVVYSWGTHAGTAGLYLAEWETTYAGGSVQTFPNGGFISVYVLEDIR